MQKIAFVAASVLAMSAYGNSSDYEFLVKETQKRSQIDSKEVDEVNRQNIEQMRASNTTTVENREKLEAVHTRVTMSNEDYNAKLEKSVVFKIRDAIQSMDIKQIKSQLAGEVGFSDLSVMKTVKMSKVDGISYATVQKFDKKNGQENFLANFGEYLSKFKTIEYVDAKLISSSGNRNEKDHGLFQFLAASDTINATVALEIRGIMADGFRRVDKAEVIVDCVKGSGDTFVINNLRYVALQTLQATRAPSFKVADNNAGFDAGKTYMRLEALRRGGYGFAIEDINNDGKLDAFIGNYGGSTVWLGTADGKFVAQDMPEVNKVTLAKAAAFVDLDNDGWKDLFVTRFAADNLVGDMVIFKNDHGKFVQIEKPFTTSTLRDYAMPTAIADFNNDGLLDVYVGFPGERDFSAGMGSGSKLAAHGLFLNKGNFKFADATQKMSGAFSITTFPHGALASDFNMDGQVDIIIMDDQKNLSPMYKNNGDGTFAVKNNDTKIMNYGYGMGIAAGDFNQDGLQDYLLSNATFNTQNRIQPGHAVNLGLRMFLNSGKSFSEAQVASLRDTGEAAGGVTVIDYDNDGLQDIYLVNGLWSGSSRDDSIDSLFAKATTLGIANQNHLQDGLGDRSAEHSKSIFMKSLMNERVGTGKDAKTMSFAGYQRNRLFKNLGNGEFIEVGYLEGVDSMSDGYMSVVADINRDGKPDLVLRNCDPGAADNMFAPVQIYQNGHEAKKGAWITLKGKKSNAMGVGAKLYATIGKQTYMREMFANNSAMQGEVVAHFGMGTAAKINKLKIVWPSGLTDTYTNVKPGHHVFQENVNAMASAH